MWFVCIMYDRVAKKQIIYDAEYYVKSDVRLAPVFGEHSVPNYLVQTLVLIFSYISDIAMNVSMRNMNALWH